METLYDFSRSVVVEYPPTQFGLRSQSQAKQLGVYCTSYLNDRQVGN